MPKVNKNTEKRKDRKAKLQNKLNCGYSTDETIKKMHNDPAWFKECKSYKKLKRGDSGYVA